MFRAASIASPPSLECRGVTKIGSDHSFPVSRFGRRTILGLLSGANSCRGIAVLKPIRSMHAGGGKALAR